MEDRLIRESMVDRDHNRAGTQRAKIAFEESLIVVE